jgi:two-component system response regulator WspF
MRIGIVNDMRLAREALRRVVESAPRHRVAWTAADGADAISCARNDRPDLILMDLIMPGVDGVEATRRIMGESPCAILVVTSSVGGNIGKVYEALGLGAVDAVDTPRLGPDGQVSGGTVLLQKIDTLEKLATCPPPGPAPPQSSGGHRPVRVADHLPPIVAVGASTGGPKVLARILADLPPGLPACVVIVQHVDAAFAGGLVQWLQGFTRLPVQGVAPGARPAPGRVIVAQTNDHLVLTPEGALDYSPEPREACYRPSVDVFFRSLARYRGEPGVAVLLTGMGRDGAEGMAALRRLGWHTIAQDEASSIVWGMPRAAIAAGCVAEVLSPAAIGPAIVGGLNPRARN